MNSSAFLNACDCAILTSPASLYYVSGLQVGDATILVLPDATYYLTSPLYEVEAKHSLKDGLILKVLSLREQRVFLRSMISDGMTVGMEKDHITVASCEALLSGKKVQTVDIGSVLSSIRMVKRADEIALIKSAESIVDIAYQSVLPFLKEGVSERNIANRLLFKMLECGADGLAFDTIVAFGENAAKPHAVPSDRLLRKGDSIVLDFGAKVKGYCSDFTRTLHCGEPSDKFKRAYSLVLEAQRAALSYIANGGRNPAEADRIAREIIDRSDFKGAFNHTLGHGVGIEIHERPYLRDGSEDLIEEGSVFTIEPGIYVEGEFGIRIESLAVIEKGKLTVIDRSDKENYIV